MMELTEESKKFLLRDAVGEWCPSFPRRVTQSQVWVSDSQQAVEALYHTTGPGFTSVNCYPEGMPNAGHVPRIESVFFDFDVPSDGLYGRPESSGEANPVSWAMDLQPLLDAVSDIVRALEKHEIIEYWRFALSGHKGVHFFIDFDALPTDMGDPHQYRAGIDRYVTELIALMEDEIGYSLSKWFDVDSSDLARLTRVPNTLHPSATRLFAESRYCVAVTPDELTDMTPGEYARLTRSPRLIPAEARRTESTNARRLLTQFIAEASPRHRGAGSYVSPTTVTEYDRNANEHIQLTDSSPSIQSILMRLPELWFWRERQDAFLHGAESHFFEFAVIQEMVSQNVPRETMLEYFRPIPGYDETFTRDRIATVISAGYQNRVSYKKLADTCPAFV